MRFQVFCRQKISSWDVMLATYLPSGISCLWAVTRFRSEIAFWALRDFMRYSYEISWFGDRYEMSFWDFVLFATLMFSWDFLMRFYNFALQFSFEIFFWNLSFLDFLLILYVFCCTISFYDFLSWFHAILNSNEVSVWDLCFLALIKYHEISSLWGSMLLLLGRNAISLWFVLRVAV